MGPGRGRHSVENHLDVWIMTSETSLRARWLQALAFAEDAEIDGIAKRLAIASQRFELLRPPELGLVMARARAGGSGAAFNLGEVAVTRCAVRSTEGIVGIGWVQGRRTHRALAIAKLDATMQTLEPSQGRAIVESLGAGLAKRRDLVARKAAATKVDFFTLVRGED